MKAITNESLQSFNIFLAYPTGIKSVYIKPKETLVVPANALTDQVELMARRRVLKIREA